MFLTIFIAIFSIIALLVIHEFGHFIVAKKFGIEVEEFGIGLPPRLLGRKIGQTFYSLNLLPFGAFVKIPSLEESGKKKGDLQKTENIPLWKKSLVVLGGVISFWITGIILFSFMFSFGASQAISDQEPGPLFNPRVQIVAVAPDSPAQIAGIRTGDVIKKISAAKEEVLIDKVSQVQEFTEIHKGEELILTIERGKEVFEISLRPRVLPPEGEGAMGLALVRIDKKSYPLGQAFVQGIKTTVALTYAILAGLADILASLIKGKELSEQIQFMGPIGIGALATQAVQVGTGYFLRFLAIISVYLAVFNLLPIPALDGGKLLFLGIEKVKGSPVSPKIEQKITAGFFAFFIALMILVTIKDIARLF